MKVNGHHYRTIWVEPETERLLIIDQTALPHRFQIMELATVRDVCRAIRDMHVRGAGLIGATAAYGMWIAARTGPSDPAAFVRWMDDSADALLATRPTASNLLYGVTRVRHALQKAAEVDATVSRETAQAIAREAAQCVADEDADYCRRIGEHGVALIARLAAQKPGQPIHILTHCNAGWLAFVDYGSALAPIYAAHDAGISVHVWVDETRPRNQGAGLTAWELGQHGVPHDLIVDNAGGHLMQHGMVDMVITGADRVTRCGDAANKIGTYLKALAAKDNGVPFYVALPSSTFDFTLCDGVRDIPIEERGSGEVSCMCGETLDGRIETVRLCPESTPARNWSFDVTPARLVTGLITERGLCDASEAGIQALHPEGRVS